MDKFEAKLNIQNLKLSLTEISSDSFIILIVTAIFTVVVIVS